MCVNLTSIEAPQRGASKPMNHIVFLGSRLAACLGVCAVLVGCGKAPSPPFRSNMFEMAKAQIPVEQQQTIANVLDAMYGTPDDPYVLPETGLDLAQLQIAAGPVRSDEFGREGGLYRRQCAHCHGTTGDGMGPTAMILNPYPRDYRQGKFKFKATERAAKPTEIDLERIVRHGVTGTAMPAFGLLPDAQIKALVAYVKYLSMRGQTEISLINAMADLGEDDKLDTSRANLVDEILTPIAESWSTASESIINPEPKPEIPLAESIAAGQKIFFSDTGNCAKCHGWSALGDGQTNDYDDWMKPVSEMAKSVASEEETLSTSTELTSEQRAEIQQRVSLDRFVLEHDTLPLRNAIPRNLRQGIYRGGRAPVDIYRRIYAGINGVPMPGVGPATPGATGTLTSDQIWNLVDYVQSLPYEAATDHPPVDHPRVSQARY
jgi:mono/diheme cytochrome c family protein